ncbi:aminopeptidase P family N-terminal domain-containing protein [Erysipelotrichaceae bacterium HCN-30851]
MITLKKVNLPEMETDLVPVTLSDETMILRKNKVLENMKKNNLDVLVIYADLEHGSNFEYLCGFLPRFEEALLVLHASGKAYMVLGNENLNKADKSRLEVIPIHMPHFSLPNQPMETEKSVSEILAQCELSQVKKIGVVGWKKFTSHVEENKRLLDIPYYLIEALKAICPQAEFLNAIDIFIGEHGVRTINNANEFAHYEFGAALAGTCMFEAMQELDVGKSEMQVAQKLASQGQPHSVVTIMAAGERFVKANMYPADKKIESGNPISMTTGVKGGLQS